jgi:hypothetical protein
LDEKTQQIFQILVQYQSVISDEIHKYTLYILKQLERNEQVATDRQKRIQAHISEMFKERVGDEAFDATTYRQVPESALLRAFGTDEQRLVISVENTILNSLKFPSMTYRYEGVSESHHRTFEWIYQENAEATQHWSDFVQWLRHGHGPYWVNGKAGSGKSTLMKYIFENPKTTEQLLLWAGQETLTIPSFFWNGGTPDQRSQSGLLRTILYDVLSTHRQLIPIVLPRYWAWNHSQAIYSSTRKSGSLSTTHLLQAFKLLIEQTILPVKICLFIDGLDEYEGNHGDLADIFLNLSASPNIKICVSSRPLLIFEDAFGNAPGLRLQDLTSPDIA